MRAAALLLAPALLAGIASALPGATLLADAPELATAWGTQRKIAFGDDGTTFVALLADEGVLVLASSNEAAWRALPPLPSANATLRGTIAWARGALWSAWTEYLPDEGHHQVFAARYHDGAWRDLARLSHTRGYSGFPSLAAAPDGTLHVAWYGLDAGSYQVFHRALPPGAGEWSAPVRLTVGEADAVNPSVAVATDGTAHVAWYKEEGPLYRAFHAKRDPAGTWSGTRALFAGNEHAKNAVLVVDPQGRAWVAWDERDAQGTRRVWVARESGAGFTAPRAASPERANASHPAITLDAQGAIVLAWATEGGPVTLARLDPTGALADTGTLGHAGARDPALSPPRAGEEPLALHTEPHDDRYDAHLATVDFASAATREVPAGAGAGAAVAGAAVAAAGARRGRA